MGRHDEQADEGRGDDVNPNPGNGASGPGEQGYDEETQIGIVGGEATIDLEEKAARVAAGDADADPAKDAPRVAEPGSVHHD